MRRTRLWLLTAICFSAAIPAQAQKLFEESSELLPKEIERMYLRGLQFLVQSQLAGGNFKDKPYGTTPAVVGLAVMAMLAHGDDPVHGPYSSPIKRGLNFIVTRQNKTTGYIGTTMYNHGFATLALAQAYAMSPKSPRGRRIERALRLAIDRIETSQGAEGGWYYGPERSLQHEGSVTIALVQALRAARNSGLRVNPETIAEAIEYVRRSQGEDGAFHYAIGHEQTSVALTAAAISTLNATGIYSGKEVLQGYDSIQRELTARESAPLSLQTPAFPLYERLYLAQAYWQHPDQTLFERWFQAEREHLLTTQEPSGAWTDPRFGSTYATSVNAIVLALPEGLLPIFQR